MPWTFHLRTTHGSSTEPEQAADAQVYSPNHSAQRTDTERAAPEQMHERDATPRGEYD